PAAAASDDAAHASADTDAHGVAGELQSLAARGVFLRANLINQYARNTRGGVDQDGSNVGQFNLGADFDLDSLFGASGGSVHFTVYRDYGHGLNHDVTGTFAKQQYIYKNEYPAWHLGLFAYQQKLLDDRLDLMIGRLGTTSYYAKLATNCQFQSGSHCGVPRLINSEAGYSLLPSATWAVNLRYRTGAHTYVETGIYEVNPTTSASNGLDFSVAEATGVTVPVEWGWARTDAASGPRTFELKVGGYVSTAPRPDPFYNTQGRSRGLYGGTARTVTDNRKGVYVMGDRAVWRPDPASNRNLTVFAGISQQLEVEEIMRQQIYGGFVLTGPTASRPQDTVGLSASFFDLTDKEAAYLRDARIRAGGRGRNDPHQFAFELNYGWHAHRGVIVMPNVQYIVHPDNSGLPNTPVLPRNLFAIGLNVQLNFGSMLGLRREAGGGE
ncbi:carbohydrate porin, partial [Xanthomonas sp. Kuri4-3]